MMTATATRPMFKDASNDEANAAIQAAFAIAHAQADYEDADHPVVVTDRFGLMDLLSTFNDAKMMLFGEMRHLDPRREWVFASDGQFLTRFDTVEEAQGRGMKAIVRYEPAPAIDSPTRSWPRLSETKWTHVPTY